MWTEIADTWRNLQINTQDWVLPDEMKEALDWVEQTVVKLLWCVDEDKEDLNDGNVRYFIITDQEGTPLINTVFKQNTWFNEEVQNNWFIVWILHQGFDQDNHSYEPTLFKVNDWVFEELPLNIRQGILDAGIEEFSIIWVKHNPDSKE